MPAQRTDDELLKQDGVLRGAWNAKAFWRTFRHESVHVNDRVRIHYVVGGEGPVMVLLHGFPQHWREWRLIMPALVDAGHRVVAADLRGFGESDKPLDGYDVGTVSEDIRQLVRRLSNEAITLVGHDVGASVAYAWAAAYPEEVGRLVLMEAFPAGFAPSSGSTPKLNGKATWHLGFLGTPDVPEALLANRERVLLSYLFRNGAYDQTTFSDDEIDAYLQTFAALGGVRGAISHIRAIPQSAAYNRKHSEKKFSMPVLAIGGSKSFGQSMAEVAAQFAEHVTGAVPERCGHWIPEERPEWLLSQIVSFCANDPIMKPMSHVENPRVNQESQPAHG
jgi:pimeloyl-ACP methyl ester carboxylesterase